jgi:alkanesulfonate monooxygenase SsuD/methylene tetrahydromethanopterin reductase-like flavin-dependent oxidoreductase (luciferase family)
MSNITVTVNELLQQLRDSYAAATSGLNTERQKLEAESQGILETANDLKQKLPAAAREAERQADKLLLAGKPEEAAAKYAKQRQAESAPGKLEDRRRTIAVRCGQIAAEEEAIARRVYDQWYPGLHAALVAEQLSMCDALDAAWTGIVRYAGETGTGGIGGIIKANLENDMTARDQGPERAIYGRLVAWFGGRR